MSAASAALPIALGVSALLLPGDPDDPNTKAFIVGAILAVPMWIVAAVVAFVLARWKRVQRAALLTALAPAIILATSGWLLLFAWPVVAATPVPETKEQVLRAQEDPHLWSPGAWRMTAAAGVLAVAGSLLARRLEDGRAHVVTSASTADPTVSCSVRPGKGTGKCYRA